LLPASAVTVKETAANLASFHLNSDDSIATGTQSTVMLTKDNIPVVIIAELWPNKVVHNGQNRSVFYFTATDRAMQHLRPLTHQSIRPMVPPPG